MEKFDNYFGVDIWAYMHNSGKGLSKAGFENIVLVPWMVIISISESQSQCNQEQNKYTSKSSF